MYIHNTHTMKLPLWKADFLFLNIHFLFLKYTYHETSTVEGEFSASNDYFLHYSPIFFKVLSKVSFCANIFLGHLLMA